MIDDPPRLDRHRYPLESVDRKRTWPRYFDEDAHSAVRVTIENYCLSANVDRRYPSDGRSLFPSYQDSSVLDHAGVVPRGSSEPCHAAHPYPMR
jgi:hypothetical protein